MNSDGATGTERLRLAFRNSSCKELANVKTKRTPLRGGGGKEKKMQYFQKGIYEPPLFILKLSNKNYTDSPCNNQPMMGKLSNFSHFQN